MSTSHQYCGPPATEIIARNPLAVIEPFRFNPIRAVPIATASHRYLQLA